MGAESVWIRVTLPGGIVIEAGGQKVTAAVLAAAVIGIIAFACKLLR